MSMSSDHPGAHEGPHKRADEPPRGPGDQGCGGLKKAHRWELAWDEPFGRAWVCAGCGMEQVGWRRPR